MTKLEKIERDIAALSTEELARVREWFERHEADAFDQRIERNAATSRPESLANAALADHREGKKRAL